MNLTPSQKEIGRRNFLKALAGTPALAALAGAAALEGPKKGGPVKVGMIGVGVEGKVLLSQFQKQWIDLRAICDINPLHAKLAAEGMAGKGWPKPREYTDLKQMLQKEDIEAVVIAVPLSAHVDVACTAMEAGKHVLCEKMMAWDIPGCQRMMETARKQKIKFEIGYQRFYNPAYQAAFEGIIKKGLLGDIYYAQTAWHRNKNWRREEAPPSPDFDPRPHGYEDWEHLMNWRLYKKHSRGLLAELGSHEISMIDWFFESVPEAVYASGGLYRFKDGRREEFDHLYATFDYPGGRTATFTAIESNGFDNNYEKVMGTKGTLIFKGESEVYLFPEADAAAKPTNLEVSPRGANAVLDASESRIAESGGRTVAQAAAADKVVDRLLGYKNEIATFCSHIRANTPLRCGPERAFGSAAACIRAYEASDQKARLTLNEVPRHVPG
jgi:predicted dehydrogenase